jgi:hypothetical protein
MIMNLHHDQCNQTKNSQFRKNVTLLIFLYFILTLYFTLCTKDTVRFLAAN